MSSALRVKNLKFLCILVRGLSLGRGKHEINRGLKLAAVVALVLLITLATWIGFSILKALGPQEVIFQVDTVVVHPSSGGTTYPSSGSYYYDKIADITLRAVPNSGNSFQYWVVSGSSYGQPAAIVDPNTGETIDSFPRSQAGVDSIVVKTNPVNITLGRGGRHHFQAVFASTDGVSHDNIATAVILPSQELTSPAAGTYTYGIDEGIALTAESGASANYFSYWVLSGRVTPSSGATQIASVYDSDTGELLGSFPRPQTSEVDSLVIRTASVNITGGNGYVIQYEAVFDPILPAPIIPSADLLGLGTAFAVVSVLTMGIIVTLVRKRK